MVYVIFSISVLMVNILPAFAPPTWTLIVFFLNYYGMNIFLVIILAVIFACIGRFILYTYVSKFSQLIFNDWEKDNLKYLGDRLGKSPKKNFAFIFIYAITPLSTTALFVASAVARVNRFVLISAFFCGRLVSYSFLAFTSQLVVKELDDIIKGTFTWEAFVASLLGLAALVFFSFLDWRALLEHKKIRLNFRIWRWNES